MVIELGRSNIRIRDYMDKQQKQLHTYFPNGHWLSSPEHVEQILMMVTYYRKNLHRFVEEYLGISLYLYQKIIIYLMGVSNFIVVIASRAAAKSFVIAIYTCCRSILFPGNEAVLTGGTRGQSRLLVQKKIRGELMGKSGNLRREIAYVKDQQNEVEVKFKNESTIFTVTCNKNAIGNRSNVNVAEEAKEIDKTIYDKVVSPFKIVRQIPFMKRAPYEGDAQFVEEPTEIFISSSIEESHWLYKTAVSARDGMLKNNGSFFLAFDYSVCLRHGIRTRRQMIIERDKLDPVTFSIEYENAVLRENSNAFFGYDLVKQCCRMTRAFYPQKNEDAFNHARNKHSIPKQPGEIRIVSADIAAIDRAGNDNSSFFCIRMFPESIPIDNKHVRNEFRIQVPYLEAFKGTVAQEQAIRIRQLYHDFSADYIVIDGRSFGLAVCDELMKVLYDQSRGVEYPPFTCMNDAAVAMRCTNRNAEPRIYCVTASAKSNDQMVVNLKQMMVEGRLDLLVPKDEASEYLEKIAPGYRVGEPDIQLFYEKPYLETMLLRKELIELTYVKAENTGLIRVKEPSGGTKDRFSALEYGSWFASQMALDFVNTQNEIQIQDARICVGYL